MKESIKNSSPSVLGDHKRVGKTFVPPIRQLEKLTFIRWAENILPEIVWIALLQDSFDAKEANEKALALATACETVVKNPDTKNRLRFAFISSYGHLTVDQKNSAKEIIRNTHLLGISKSLSPLTSLYPNCPLSFLIEAEASEEVNAKEVDRMKSVVGSISDRHGRPAMLAQATAIYIDLITEHLKVFKGSGLEDLEGIVEYPATERSRKVASHIRASMNGVTMIGESKESEWCEYFWNRGYEISGCMI